MIRAEVGEHVVTKASYSAIVLATDLYIANLPATVNRCLHVFTARLDPFNRLAELHGDPAQQRFFSVDIEFRAEAPAYFGGNHAQFVFGNADHQCELRTKQMWYLR